MDLKFLNLLLFLNIKHFIADFVLQNQKIATNKGKNFYYLILHSLHHAGLTLIVLVLFKFNFFLSLLTAASEIFTHSFFDFLKANENLLGRYKYPTKLYFVFLGLDQLFHYINYLLMVAFLALRK